MSSLAARWSNALEGRTSLSYERAFLGVTLLSLLAFAASYRALLPLASSESATGVALIIPFAGIAVLFASMRNGVHVTEEVSVNVMLASPLLLALGFLLLWAPPRFSFFYSEYRLDLLALPVFLLFAFVMLFGVATVSAGRAAIPLLLLGWPPVLEDVTRIVAGPLAQLDAEVVGWIVSPLPNVTRDGTVFYLGPHHDAVSYSETCAGLVGIASVGVLAAVAVAFARGAVRSKARWLATAIGAAFLANVLRLTVLTGIGAYSGVTRELQAFHYAGGMVFGFLACIVMLLLLRRFGLELRRPLEQRGQRVEVPTRTFGAVAAIVLAVGAFAAWADVGLKLHVGASRIRPTVTARNLLPAPPDMREQIGDRIPEVPGLFGSDAVGRLIFFNRGPIVVTAQVLVAPSYDVANRYGVKNCFTQHGYRIYSTHHAALPGGGTAELVAIRYGTRDYATINWTQPVELNGRLQWRRVVLFEQLRPAPHDSGAYRASGIRALGLWLLDKLSPYGSVHPPPRFKNAEASLATRARQLVQTSVDGKVGI
jgi:exosortase/archaeosortase family protein